MQPQEKNEYDDKLAALEQKQAAQEQKQAE